MSFIITTLDSEYTYTALTSNGGEVIEQWDIKNNNKESDTQGFLHKVEKGETRVETLVSLTDSKANLIPILTMLTYPSNVNVTFNRNILGKTTNQGEFTMSDLSVKQEFNDGNDMEIVIKLIEVLD